MEGIKDLSNWWSKATKRKNNHLTCVALWQCRWVHGLLGGSHQHEGLAHAQGIGVELLQHHWLEFCSCH
jgi:hypothetical protein